MNTIEKLQEQIDEINNRNKRVEKDKAWESSLTRKVTIVGLTYLVVMIFFLVLNLPNPLLSAIVPSVAFVLSTMTLPFVKRVWIKKF